MKTQSDDISSDASAFTEEKADNPKEQSSPKRSKSSSGMETKSFDQTMDEVMARVNKATAFLDTEAFQNAAAASVGQVGRERPVISHQTQGRNSNSQFNIIGGSIGQAAIGNVGDVVFNQEQKIFEKGAVHSNFNITGGNFAQANIGGTANYNNDKGTTISAGEGGGSGRAFFTPEQLVLHILERGVTCQELAQLLDRQYTLVNLAFALPKEPMKRNNMLRALLAATPMEVN